MKAIVLCVSLFSHYLNTLVNEDFESPLLQTRELSRWSLCGTDTDSASVQTLIFPTPGSPVPSRGYEAASLNGLPLQSYWEWKAKGRGAIGVEWKWPHALGLVHGPLEGTGCSWAPGAHMDGDSLCMTQNTEATLPSVWGDTQLWNVCPFSDSILSCI